MESWILDAANQIAQELTLIPSAVEVQRVAGIIERCRNEALSEQAAIADLPKNA